MEADTTEWKTEVIINAKTNNNTFINIISS